MGYDRDHVVVLPMRKKMLDDLAVIKEELKTNPSVISVSRCVSTPVKIPGGYNMRTDQMPESEQHAVTATPIDEDYIKTTGLEIIAGSDLTEQDNKDVADENREDRIYHFILNESAAEDLGWSPEEAVGKKMFMGDREGFVRGVVRDFHFESMHNSIKPLVLFTEIRGNNLLVKVSGKNLPETISFLEKKWKQLVPFVPFEYHFLDDDYNGLYKSELQLGIGNEFVLWYCYRAGLSRVVWFVHICGSAAYQRNWYPKNTRRIAGPDRRPSLREIYNPGNSCHCYSLSVSLSVNDAMASGICVPR